MPRNKTRAKSRARSTSKSGARKRLRSTSRGGRVVSEAQRSVAGRQRSMNRMTRVSDGDAAPSTYAKRSAAGNLNSYLLESKALRQFVDAHVTALRKKQQVDWADHITAMGLRQGAVNLLREHYDHLVGSTIKPLADALRGYRRSSKRISAKDLEELVGITVQPISTVKNRAYDTDLVFDAGHPKRPFSRARQRARRQLSMGGTGSFFNKTAFDRAVRDTMAAILPDITISWEEQAMLNLQNVCERRFGKFVAKLVAMVGNEKRNSRPASKGVYIAADHVATMSNMEKQHKV